MAMSTGGRKLAIDMLGWVCALGLVAVAILYASEIRGYGYKALGIKDPRMQVASDDGIARQPAGQQRAGTRPARAGYSVELKAGRNGHFFAEAEINGRRIEVMIDTGASLIALTYEDAQAAGVVPRDADFTHRVSTANGTARVAPVTLSRVQIGDVLVRNVEAAVAEPGKLNVTLVGNSFLGRLSRYEMRSGRMVLEE
jgi:aspartyl protease family protein